MTVAETAVVDLPEASVTTPRGFRAGAVAAGIKPSGRPDLGIVASDVPCVAAATFTQNAFPAAPVVLSRERVRAQGRAQAIVFNAGNANACNADQGLADAREMTAITADLLHLDPELVLVASTGVIGRPLPMDRIRDGLPRVELRSDGGPDAARAIMTTDTRPKTAGARFVVQGREVNIGAMVKGVGMIHPAMATMLAFIATDAALNPELARQTLNHVVDRTFNMVTVDGDTSTNDSCFLLANGLSESATLTANSEGAASFIAALQSVCTRLARAMAADGEGATKLITVDITGARSEDDARAAAREVVRSSLVKAAVHGEDPNWGRIFAAVGNSSATVDPLRAALWVGTLQIARDGRGLGVSEAEQRAQMGGDEVTFRVDLGLGTASARAWGCDLTEAYVVENSAYTT
jgi:glutamate N-acetyltransferase/amino-acid N-acetyltransferase